VILSVSLTIKFQMAVQTTNVNWKGFGRGHSLCRVLLNQVPGRTENKLDKHQSLQLETQPRFDPGTF